MSDDQAHPILPSDRASLIQAMRGCEQARGQSVLDHGIAVAACFADLRTHIEAATPLEPWWRVPDWARTPGLLDRLPEAGILIEYQTFHDCGKPFCIEVDDQGRRHFPGHAAMSERAWLAAGGHPLAARLMGMDMDAHLLKGEGIAEFAARPEAPALLLTALAEVHANAEMFGGTDSDSFKIKAKHLEKRGRQVLAATNPAAPRWGQPT